MLTIANPRTFELSETLSVRRSSLLGMAVTWLLMIPLICLAVDGQFWFRTASATDPLIAQFGVLATTTPNSDNIYISLLLFALLPLIIYPKTRQVTAALFRDKVFLAIAVWSFASTLWSQFPSVTLQWAPVAALNAILAFYLFQRFSPEQQMRLMLLVGTLCLAGSFLVSVSGSGVDSSSGGSAVWRGIYAQKNMCCMVTQFLLLAALYAPSCSLRFNIFRWTYISASAILILMTQSATGKITLVSIFGFAGFTRLIAKLRSEERSIVFVLATSVSVAICIAGFAASREISFLLGKDPTLTGRTDIWQAVIPSIAKHPILGYGYKAFWRGYQGESANVSLAAHWAVSSAHNGFLEVWLSLGGVGLCLIVYTFIRGLRDALLCLRVEKSPYLAWYASIIVLMLVISVDEGELANPFGLMWMMYIMACLGLAKAAREIGMSRTDG